MIKQQHLMIKQQQLIDRAAASTIQHSADPALTACVFQPQAGSHTWTAPSGVTSVEVLVVAGA
jgi:hypothetical protein